MKTVLPITGRQTGELCRLLEERGVGFRTIQKVIEDPNRLTDFILTMYGRFFSPQTCKALRGAGYEIVQAPGILTAPVTLQRLYQTQEEFGARFERDWVATANYECLPLPAGELAWKPANPLIPESLEASNTFADQKKVVVNFSRQVQERFGSEVKAIFPTAEAAVYLLFDHCRRTGKFRLLKKGPFLGQRESTTWTLNRYDYSGDVCRIAVGPSREKGIVEIRLFSSEGKGLGGVFRLIVPT